MQECSKALAETQDTYIGMLYSVRHSPCGGFWSTYDEVADVLYIYFTEPGPATDSEITEGDIVVWHEGEEIMA